MLNVKGFKHIVDFFFGYAYVALGHFKAGMLQYEVELYEVVGLVSGLVIDVPSESLSEGVRG